MVLALMVDGSVQVHADVHPIGAESPGTAVGQLFPD
jgi:hypothetical protein